MNHVFDFTPGAVASLACSLEVAAPKVGNVHRAADFEEGVFEDFLVSAILLGQVIDTMADCSVGETILAVVKQTQRQVGHNTNLGLALLLVPLAKATSIVQRDPVIGSRRSPTANAAELRSVLVELLQNLTVADSRAIYQAIDLANPGGLDRVERGDVKTERDKATPMPVIMAMELAADRDLIARQFTNGFQQVFVDGMQLLQSSLRRFPQLPRAIVHLQLALLSRYGDSLIERKCGATINQQVKTRATSVLDQIELNLNRQLESWEQIEAIIGEFDFWSRSDGHRRNPGTTADLIGATLYVAITCGILSPPFR